MSMDVDLLIAHGLIVTQNRNRAVIPDGAVAIQGNKIVAVGSTPLLSQGYRARKVIKAQEKVIIPGLINTHTHLFQTFLKGLGDGMPLLSWIRNITTPSALNLTEQDCYLAAMLGCMESIRSGTTTVLDFMYSLPNPYLYDQIIRAFEDSGIRGILARGITEVGEEYGLPTGMLQPAERALQDVDRLLSCYQGAADGRIGIQIAVGIIWGMTKPGLEMVRQFADDNGVKLTMHLNETPVDNEHSLKSFGRHTFPFLADIGFLGPDVLAVHCVDLNDSDLSIIAGHEVKVSHNPVSNMYLGVGIAPLLEMIAQGITVGLATDGAASNNSQDMIEVMKCAALLQRVAAHDPSVLSAEQILRLATVGGAKATGLDDRVGSLEVGKEADLVIVDPYTPKAIPILEAQPTLVYSLGEENIDTVIVNGRIILEDGHFTALDEEDLLQKAQQAAVQLSLRAGTRRLQTEPIPKSW